MRGQSTRLRASWAQARGAACPLCILALSQGSHSVSPCRTSQMPCQPLPSAPPQPWGRSAMPEDIFGCHDPGRGCYWHPAGRGQGCHSASYSAQDSPTLPPQRITQPRRAAVPRMRNHSGASSPPSHRCAVGLNQGPQGSFRFCLL